ncbi:MAG: potassium channel protein [Planctomycetota bacterium]|nr:MAG: potassium channel protein [Planctomycetota bacterium]
MFKEYRRITIPLILMACIFLYGMIGFKIIFGKSWANSLYKTVVVLGTVNEPYEGNEAENLEREGKILISQVFTISLVFIGMGGLLFFLSSITAFFVEGDLRNILQRRRMQKKIEELSNHFIVCGAGETGAYIVEELHHTRRPFVVIDSDQEHIDRLGMPAINFIVGDATEDETLLLAGIKHARGIMCVLANDQENLFVTLTARQLNPKLRIIAKVVSRRSEDKLKAAGADSVVTPSFIGGMRLVSEMIRPSVVTFLDKMMRGRKQVTRIEEVSLSPGSKLSGKSLKECDFGSKTGVLVIATKHPEEEDFHYNPDPNTTLDDGTTLVVIGNAESVSKARDLAGMG